MKTKHILSSQDFDKDFIKHIFKIADDVRNNKFDKNALNGKIMTTLFYEPSTRTRLSFESAMLRLGGSVISTENASEFSSAAKGETLEDTIRIINSYCDVIVIRHYSPGASKIAADFSKVPIINAGDGNGEHPTQALLDLYTITNKIKDADFTVAMVGDLLNGRTIHSLSLLLSLYEQVEIIFVSPKDLRIPSQLRKHLNGAKTKFTETDDLKMALKNADVVYQTRIQKERFENMEDYNKYFGKFILDKKNLALIKPNGIILHPLPRVNEISPEVDDDPRAMYFEQAQNGVYIRIALLLYLFDKAPSQKG